jgi:hypothetical protein
VEKVVVPLRSPHALVAHKKKEIKVEWVILDLVKDHIIPHLSKNNMTKYMIDSLIGLFQSTNMNRNMVLRNRLKSM